MSDAQGSNDDPVTGGPVGQPDPDRAPGTAGDDLFAAYEAALARTKPSGAGQGDETPEPGTTEAAPDAGSSRAAGSALSDAIGEEDLGDESSRGPSGSSISDRDGADGQDVFRAPAADLDARDEDGPEAAASPLWSAAGDDARADADDARADAEGSGDETATAREGRAAPLFDATVREEASRDEDASSAVPVNERSEDERDRDEAAFSGLVAATSTESAAASGSDASAADADRPASADASETSEASGAPRDRDADPVDGGAPATPRDASEGGAPSGSGVVVDNDHDGEPDYAALAAELEEFERRNAGTATSDDGQRDDPWYGAAPTETFTASEPSGEERPAEAAPVVTASEPVIAPAPAPSPAPVFVQVPEAPRMRGNRGAAGLIGLLAALVFAALYFVATLGWRLLTGAAEIASIGTDALDLVLSFEMWVPVAVFWLGFWLLGAIINRARWGTWVTLGFFVGVVSYGGHLLGQLFQAPFWMITASEAAELLRENLLSPLAIAAFVFGREITIWFAAWVARRGAKVTAANAEAQAEYERTLEAGPQLPE